MALFPGIGPDNFEGGGGCGVEEEEDATQEGREGAAREWAGRPEN